MSAEAAILIAEDDEGHAALVKRSLKSAGLAAEPIHLCDGQEVLDYPFRRASHTDRPLHREIVLPLDLNMPRLGGLDVLRHLKSHAVLSRVPVVVLTTTDDPAEIDRCYQLGCAVCLVKPVEFGGVADTMHALAAFVAAAIMPGEVSPAPRDVRS